MPATVTLLTSAAEPDSAAVAAALKRAIFTEEEETSGKVNPALPQVEISAVETLSNLADAPTYGAEHLCCPLTLELPDNRPFPRQALYRRCRDVAGLREQVKAAGYAVGMGDLWLPVVWTAKGPLYGEAIARDAAGNYYQPYHLSDGQRQPLYRLGQQLLRQLNAPPSVYLLQVAWDDHLVFDRLWPFPTAPAIASLGAQSPDLFACHWRCLTGQPIRDLQVTPRSEPAHMG